MIFTTEKQLVMCVGVAAFMLTGLAFMLWGSPVGTGVAVGGVVAVFDALVLTWLTSHIILGAGLIGRALRPRFLALNWARFS